MTATHASCQSIIFTLCVLHLKTLIAFDAICGTIITSLDLGMKNRSVRVRLSVTATWEPWSRTITSTNITFGSDVGR